MNAIEIFGYVSMIAVLLSIMLTDVIALRTVNSIACLMFIIYGSLINSYPVIVMNSLCIIINIYKIIKHKK